MSDVYDLLREIVGDDAKVFVEPSYESAIVGTTDDDRVVYDYDLMLEYLVKEKGMDLMEAADTISYDTIKSLSFSGSKAPVILFRFGGLDARL